MTDTMTLEEFTRRRKGRGTNQRHRNLLNEAVVGVPTKVPRHKEETADGLRSAVNTAARHMGIKVTTSKIDNELWVVVIGPRD